MFVAEGRKSCFAAKGCLPKTLFSLKKQLLFQPNFISFSENQCRPIENVKISPRQQQIMFCGRRLPTRNTISIKITIISTQLYYL